MGQTVDSPRFLDLLFPVPFMLESLSWRLLSGGLRTAGILVLGGCLGMVEGRAHHDPATDAVALTEKMQEEGPKVDLLLERARVWRVLRKPDLAIRDLAEASSLDPTSVEVKRRLARAYYADGQLKPAFNTLEAALKLAKAPEDRADLLMLRASVRLVWRSYAQAADDCTTACEVLPDHGRIEWYLRRAYAQRMADRLEACRQGLYEGFKGTGSAVLYAQWVDALIDVGQLGAARREVEKQLPGLRFSASWTIRRARILLAENDEDAAKKALEAALEELNGRIRPDADYPDVTLLIDRGFVHLLLGDRKAAQADYDRANEAGAIGWMHWRLKQVFDPGKP